MNDDGNDGDNDNNAIMQHSPGDMYSTLYTKLRIAEPNCPSCEAAMSEAIPHAMFEHNGAHSD